MAGVTGRDIDALWAALRPRILGLSTGGSSASRVGPQGPAGPKGVTWRGAWAADTDYETGDLVTSPNALGSSLVFICISANTSIDGSPPTVGGDVRWYELGPAYLIIDGSRAMTGDLNMGGHSIGYVENLTMTGGVGEAIVSGVRVQHFTGDASDGEATQDGLERTVYNDEPTKSSIENPSRIDFNPAVTAGSHWALAEGRVGHNISERALVGVVVSGSEDGLNVVPEFFAVALGWTVFNCIAYEIEA